VREYTLLAFGSAAAITVLDHLLKTKVTHRRSFWITQAIMLFFEIPTNGYLTSRPIVLYNPEMFLNLRLWTIPVEDFVYGYGLITLTLIFWDYFGAKRNRLGTQPSA
jgi:lycopene cyclase domain-containing protein